MITSCRSAEFPPETEGIAAEMSGIGPAAALILLAATGAAVAISGAVSYFFGRGGMVFSAAGAVFFIAALTAIVSVISGYIYEHPNHHCPFCILRPEYGYLGNALHIPLFLGTAFAPGAGALQPFRRIESLSATLPARLRRHVGAALVAYVVFGLVVLWTIYRSRLILFG